MKIRLIFFLCFFLSAGWSLCAFSDTPPTDLQKKIENAIRQGQASQSKAEAWTKQRETYLNEIRELKNRKRWLGHQQNKYQIYIQKQQETLAELERKKKETEKIKMSLEPFLDELFTRLEESVKKDLPFLSEERQKRLQFLKDSLDNYHLGLDEKTRRVLEALQVEAGYGGTVEKTEGTIPLENRSAQVNIFRLGRVAMFYQSLDGKHAGWFDREKRQWKPLPDKYAREISRALEIAEKKRTPELLDLPIGSPEP
ncbi:DUF3450 domain-containing protein [Desulfonema magnum]|uniref:UCP028069 n=1 Tax=Desulfonema magnum TaxID=45655 RepID=A0A975GLL4_9BACT|nr:DUF3450 domain-containing protein [Desulfonema magnum]QTA85887.1 UCP028069 [Desulfonema magnum]